MTRLVFAFLPAAMLVCGIARAGESYQVSIKEAFRDENGNVLVYFDTDYAAPGLKNPGFFRKSRVFYGTINQLQQLDGGPAGGSWSTSEKGTWYSGYYARFKDPRLKEDATLQFGAMSGPEFPLEDVTLKMTCGTKTAKLKGLPRKQLEALNAYFHAGKAVLNPLPDVRAPKHRFKMPRTGEEIFIDKPVAGLQGEYRVFTGKPPRLKQVKYIDGAFGHGFDGVTESLLFGDETYLRIDAPLKGRQSARIFYKKGQNVKIIRESDPTLAVFQVAAAIDKGRYRDERLEPASLAKFKPAELGLNEEDYKPKSYPTPCDVVLGRAAALQAVEMIQRAHEKLKASPEKFKDHADGDMKAVEGKPAAAPLSPADTEASQQTIQ